MDEEPALGATASEKPLIDTGPPLRVVRDRWLRWVERRYLEQILTEHGTTSVSAAARAAGVDRVHVHRLLKAARLR